MDDTTSQRRIPSGERLSALAVAIVTLSVFVPALWNGFVRRDDDFYLYNNHFITRMDAAFFKASFLEFYKANWHPLTWVSHALDYALWGLNPLGHHLTSIILHSANAFLVVLLIFGLLDVYRSGTSKGASFDTLSFPTEKSLYIIAISTGLLFGIHPLRVESVAWASERKDVLCGLFSLLSLLSYVKHLRTADSRNGLDRFFGRHYLTALAFFVCALLSKSMAVTLPVALLILDWYPFERIRSLKTFLSALPEKIPFLVLALVSAVITYAAQKSGGTVAAIGSIPLSSRLIVSATALVTYLGEMLWPLNLNPFNSYQENISLSSPHFLSSLLLAIGLTAAAVFSLRKSKFWMASWVYYCVTLLPVLGLVQVGVQATADRYTYLPSIGPSLMMSVALALTYEKMERARTYRVVLTAAAGVAAIVLLCILSVLTVRQIGIWRNSITLWTCAIDNSPKGMQAAQGHQGVFLGVLYRNRAVAYIERGEYEKALEDLNKAIELYPGKAEFYSNRGLIHLRTQKYDDALADLDTAIELDPSQPISFANRGTAYHIKGRDDRALEDFTKAIALSPEEYRFYNDRAKIYSALNLPDKAIEDLSASISLHPADAMAYYNRGHLYLTMSNKRLAASDLRKACELGLERGCLELRGLPAQ